MEIEKIICSMLIHDALSFTKYKLTSDMFQIKEFKGFIQYLEKNSGSKDSKELNQIFLSKSNNKEMFLSFFELEKILDVFRLKTIVELLYKNVIKNAIKTKIDLIEGSLTDKTALEEVEEILNEVTLLIKQLSAQIVIKNPADSYRDYLAGVISHLDNNDIVNGVVGVSSGIAPLDAITKGFKPSEYIILAGRPSMGKTSLALDIVASAIRDGLNVLFLSIEMPTEQIVARLIPKINKRLELNHSLYGTDYELKKHEINEAIAIIDNSNLHIEDFREYSSVTMIDIEKVTASYEEKNGSVDLVILDYVQLLSSTIKSSDENVQMTDNSRRIKAMCKKTKAPWIALSQLSRSLEQRADKRPLNSDLRSSGSLEQDADLIVFPYRENVYLERSLREQLSKKPDNVTIREAIDSLKRSPIESAEVIISKNRNGELGSAEVQFVKASASYINIGEMIMYDDSEF